MSTGSPNAWSYTVGGFGPGGGQTLTAQNPTVILNGQGTFSITMVATNGSGNSAPVVHTIQVLPAPNAILNPATQTTCIGGSVTSITVTQGGPGGGGSNTYSWSTGSTASVLSLPSLTSTNVYTCVITGTNGCSATRQATVNIGVPAISVSSTPSNICVGSTSTLIATGSGGGPYTYTWSNASNTRTTTVSNAGVYQVTVTNNAGCTGTQTYSIVASNTVAVNATATPSNLCAGNTATLRATGATSYTWSNGSSSATTTLSPNASGTYTVVASTGTCSGSAAVTIMVSQQPTVVASANPLNLCAGQSTTLTSTGADSFTWAAGVGTGSQVVATPTANQTYTVRGQNIGCPIRTATIAVTVAPAPVIQVSTSGATVCAGNEVALAANGASTYVWANNSATSAIILVNPVSTTIYTVTGTVNNCSSTATITQYVDACTGLSTENVSRVLLFPVPASSVVYATGLDSPAVITDLRGQQQLMVPAEMAEKGIDVSALEPGIYLFISGAFTTRLVIIR